MKRLIFTLIILFQHFCMFSQSVGIGTTNPDSDAILEIWSLKSGLLLTNSFLEETDKANPLNNHVEGMITYNINESGLYLSNSVHDGLYYNDGIQWNFIGPNAIVFGDIKYSCLNSDHNGWYLLDGRNINTLSNNAKNNAIAIGLSTNLYNANDCFLKSKQSAENLGTISGSNNIILTQSNLPNVDFLGSTSYEGSHNHNYLDMHSPTQSLGLATNVLALLPIINVTVGRPETTPSNNFTSELSGNHSHSLLVNSGGLNVPIEATPKHMITNIFIYLGE